MRRIVMAVAVVLAGCGGAEPVPRTTVAWNQDAMGAVACPGADEHEVWDVAVGRQQTVCRWYCVGEYAGQPDRDVIVVIERNGDVPWSETTGAGVREGCH